MNLLAFTTILPDTVNPMSNFYNEFSVLCYQTYEALYIFAVALAFAGLLMHVYKGTLGGDLSGMFGHLVVTGLVASIMPFYGEWIMAAQETLGSELLEALGMDPGGIIDSFTDSFSDLDVGSEPDFLDFFGFIDPLKLIDYLAGIIASFCMIIVGIITYVLMFLAYQVQIIALYMGCAASPIFMGMLLFDQTRESAIKYHVGMIAICFWPLGWGLGLMFADALLTGGTELIITLCNPAFGPFGVLTAAIALVILIVMVAGWIIFTVFKAPGVVQRALTTGAQIGMAFAGQAASSAAAGLGTATSMASSAAGMIPVVGGAASSAIGSVGSAGKSLGNQAAGMAKE